MWNRRDLNSADHKNNEVGIFYSSSNVNPTLQGLGQVVNVSHSPAKKMEGDAT